MSFVSILMVAWLIFLLVFFAYGKGCSGLKLQHDYERVDKGTQLDRRPEFDTETGNLVVGVYDVSVKECKRCDKVDIWSRECEPKGRKEWTPDKEEGYE